MNYLFVKKNLSIYMIVLNSIRIIIMKFSVFLETRII